MECGEPVTEGHKSVSTPVRYVLLMKGVGQLVGLWVSMAEVHSKNPVQGLQSAYNYHPAAKSSSSRMLHIEYDAVCLRSYLKAPAGYTSSQSSCRGGAAVTAADGPWCFT